MAIATQAYKLVRTGSINGLELVSEDLEPLSKGQVRVAVKALGLNFSDIFSVLGLYYNAPKGQYIPGNEFSGVIEEINSENPTNLKPGDRVFGILHYGAFRTKINVNIEVLRPIPENWTFEQAAAFPIQAVTAYYTLVELGNVKRGKTVLVHSAAGGVGLYSLQIVKKLGGTFFGTVSSRDKAD